MSYSDYEILVEIEDIFKKDSRTKNYTIISADNPDEPPDPNACPSLDVFPMRKERTLTRIGDNPYIASSVFDILCWEYSQKDYKDAFSRIVSVEENVFEVLLDNKNLNSKVLTTTIGMTEYDYYLYYQGYYIRMVISVIAQTNR